MTNIRRLLVLALACPMLISCESEDKKTLPPSETPSDKRLNFTIVPGKELGLLNDKNCMPEDVLELYGDFAVADSVYLGEGFWGPGVVLFPEEPRKTVEIFWDKDFSKKYPAFMRVSGDSTGSDWVTSKGVTIGMDLSKIEALNGSPFTLFGFGWDYGGYVTDYGNGQFNNTMGLRFEPSAGQYSDKIIGDQIVASNLPELVEAAPKVSSMEFRILAKEKLPDCIAERVNNYEGRGRMNVRTIHLNGIYHYWLNDGAAAYDGTEVVLNDQCEELCQFGGFREPLECMKVYENKIWELAWEE